MDLKITNASILSSLNKFANEIECRFRIKRYYLTDVLAGSWEWRAQSRCLATAQCLLPHTNCWWMSSSRLVQRLALLGLSWSSVGRALDTPGILCPRCFLLSLRDCFCSDVVGGRSGPEFKQLFQRRSATLSTARTERRAVIVKAQMKSTGMKIQSRSVDSTGSESSPMPIPVSATSAPENRWMSFRRL